MPAPLEFRKHLITRLSGLLPRLIDRVWDAAVIAEKGFPKHQAENHLATIGVNVANAVIKSTIPPRGQTKPKLKQGEARDAVRKVIQLSRESGISRARIAIKVRPLLGYQDISPNTLKRALMDLRKAREIVTYNSSWYPADSDVVAPGRVKTVLRGPDLKGYERE